MKIAEAKKSIREMLRYLLNVDDEDVIEGYAGTFDDIMESYAEAEYERGFTAGQRNESDFEHSRINKQP